MFNKITSGLGCVLAVVVFTIHVSAGSWDIAMGWGAAALWAFSAFLKD